MIYQELDPQQYVVRASSGTTAVASIHLGEADTFIVVENVSMLSGDVVLLDAPNETHHRRKFVRPEVVARLERSLKEYADVWAELSKH